MQTTQIVVLPRCVDDFYEGFLANLILKKKARSTIESHVYQYTHFVRPIVGGVDIDNLVLAMGDTIASKARNVAESNAARAVITFRQVLRYISRQGYRLPFDWRDMEIPQYVIRKEVEAYDKSDLKKIRHFLITHAMIDSPRSREKTKIKFKFTMARMRALFELNLHTGLRISECPPLNLTDLNWDTGEIKMVNSKTKRLNSVYFHGAEKALAEYIIMRKDKSPALFVTYEGTRVSKDALKSQFREVKLKLGLKKNFASHMLRKTFGTFMARGEGVDLKTLQGLMRHTSIRATLNYYIALDKDRAMKAHKKVMSSV